MDKKDIVPPTPESFSKKRSEKKESKISDVKQEQLYNMQEKNQYQDRMPYNPYLERGYTFPYQVAQNRYQQQVFGHSDYRPDIRPEPLDGRYQKPQVTRTDRYGAHPLQVDRDRRPELYNDTDYEHEDDKRGILAGAYRGGRPDLGFYAKDPIYVPYPQEPLNRRKNHYDQPPEIGFDPYKDPVKPRPNSVSMKPSLEKHSASSSRSNSQGPNPGWYLMMRFHKDGESQVRHALTMCQKHIEDDGGRILGLARPYGILIFEGGDAWVTFGKLRHFGDTWDVQQNPKEERTNYCVLVIFYPSLDRAIQWFDRDGFFKQKDFPPPYSTDAIVLPAHGSADTGGDSRTLVLTEYFKITHPEFFRDRFATPTEDLMKLKYKARPYVVKATSLPVDNPRERVARHLRGSWIKRNSVITLSLFQSLRDAVNYFNDKEYLKCKEYQDRVADPTTVIIDLEDWKL